MLEKIVQNCIIGKKLMVNNRSDFDHIKPLALGGKHTLSNLQALCPGCHRLKTREDRYKISQVKKKKPEIIYLVEVFLDNHQKEKDQKIHLIWDFKSLGSSILRVSRVIVHISCYICQSEMETEG